MAADSMTDAPDSETTGSGVRVLDYSNDPRTRALLALKSFWEGTQHDHCPANWDGSPRTDPTGYLVDRFSVSAYTSTNLNADAWSYAARRPNASAPMQISITSAFTAALLGRQAGLATPSDPRTAKYLKACAEQGDLWAVLTEARNYAGTQSASSVVLSVINGEISFDAYWADEMHVLEWADAAGWRPLRALWQTRIGVEQDPDKDGCVESKTMVRTKMWDDEFVYLFEDVPEDHEGDIPVVDRIPHKMGRCPVFWLQNTRNSREPEGTYDLRSPQILELCDQLDRVQSFGVLATKANASPTLYRKDHMHWLQRGGPVRKGHGAEITGTPDGDVKLIESSGEGVVNSWATARAMRLQIMQATNCVLPDPEWAVSNIAVETFLMLFRAMDSQCDILQVPLTRCILEICDTLITLGKSMPILDKEKAPASAKGLRLPPCVEVTEPTDDDDVDAEPTVKTAPYEVGDARYVEVIWPPRQLLSPTQLAAYVGALGSAVMQKLLSEESAVEDLASARGRDPAVEKRRLRAAKAKAKSELLESGLVPGGLAGDQQAADEETDDSDGDGMIGEGGPNQRPAVKKPADPASE